jgi:hypothetical protein
MATISKPTTSGLFKLPDIPDSGDIHEHRGMAYFPGTGPAGENCGRCQHYGVWRKANEGTNYERLYWSGACAQFKRLTGKHGPPIGRENSACKYFEGKRKKDENRNRRTATGAA